MRTPPLLDFGAVTTPGRPVPAAPSPRIPGRRAAAGRAAWDDLRSSARTPGGRRVLRRTLTAVVLVLAGAVTVMAAALFVAMRIDDARIDRHPGTATATVLTVSVLHTGIEFVDGRGQTVRPPDGVLYPGLLSVGQQFLVEYSTDDPTVVRVAGRTAAVGNFGVAMTVGLTWLVAAGLLVLVRRRPRRRSRAADLADPPTVVLPPVPPGPVDPPTVRLAAVPTQPGQPLMISSTSASAPGTATITPSHGDGSGRPSRSVTASPAAAASPTAPATSHGE
jgi:hypothetical protein